MNQFTRTANPIITQLRPVARQLSPTLQAAGRLAPSFRDFFVNLGPLITAAKPGFPAFRQFLADARPALGQLDPFTRSLNPFLAYVADFLPELDGFVGNIVAATQAFNLEGPLSNPVAVHYLRTASVFNPDGMTTYPQRLATNRSNPYRFPGQLNQLSTGLPVFEGRQCASGPRPVPDFPPDYASTIGGLSADAKDLLLQFAFRNDPSNVPAPACREQGPTPGFGTDFPHVVAEPPGANNSP